MMRARFAIAVAAGMLLSCSSATDPALEAELRSGHFTTDATEYRARRIERIGQISRFRFTVVTSFQNRTTAPLYLGRCFPNSSGPEFSAFAADLSTESAYAQISACVGHDQQFEILPGAIRIDTLQVDGPNSFSSITNESSGITEGAFRLYLDVRTARGDGAPLASEAERRSNRFMVSIAE